jgi:hypothetical protein
MEDFEFPFEINYKNIVMTKDILPMARLLASDLMINPYMTVGMYMQEAKDTDLELIMELSEDEEDERLSDILLMAEMLARAEGVTSPDIDTVHNHLNSFISLAAITLLDRKGFVDADYNVMSFGEEFAQHIVAKRKD